ncbi:four helix bundle protein [Flavobacterium sp. 123]|uniref:four helix bundle protein n=1 Tax=Flavobacterium sp. 123 TaxID=2135627 RepID=UPI0026C211E8
MSSDVIKIKSFSFAVRIVNLYKTLNTRNEYVMSKQILRSGTSVGANIREAKNAESKADFIHKMGISQKEAD